MAGPGTRGGGIDPRLAEFLERTTIPPTRDFSDFDPVKSSDEQISDLQLPPRPDRLTQPTGYAFWIEMFALPLKLQPPKFAISHDARLSPPLSAAGATRQESSLNWSGAYVSPRDGRVFTAVRGQWIVPDPRLPAGAPAAVVHASSAWIGLDGQRRYLHASLPQIGTAQVVTLTPAGPVTALSTWVQWWVRDQHYPPVDLCLPVSVGDRIAATIDVITTKEARFFIRNLTTGFGVLPFDVLAPKAHLPSGPSPVQLEISGATAEWVLERPTNINTQVLERLPDYDRAEFSSCHAAATNRHTGSVIDQELGGARLLQMYERRSTPSRTAVISRAGQTGDRSLVTRYNAVP